MKTYANFYRAALVLPWLMALPSWAAPSEKIDRLIEAKLTEVGQPTSDHVFLRRVYLDIVGRIPTATEARGFLNEESDTKRGELIDALLYSEGYVNHWFNYWADVLRVNQTANNSGVATPEYVQFIKDFLRENRSYDSFVRNLVTADGAVWDNGAVGYYMRDRGMPLDNMATTVRIFLGTRLECAQCHDHPFDKWTQKQFFEMAAFSFGMRGAGYGVGNSDEIRLLMRDSYGRGNRDSRDSQLLRSVFQEVSRPLRYTRVEANNRLPHLPDDYQYDNGVPGDRIHPNPIFGPEVETGLREMSDRVGAYGGWMTSKDNPRFTTVIVNRMWSEVFGRALIEPLDEITDLSEASNPELLAYLEELMREMDYDLRGFLSVLYNTKAYQRASGRNELIAGVTHDFSAPQLKRMTAEQIWDSFVTLLKPNPDEGNPAVLERSERQLKQAQTVAMALESLEPEEFVAGVKQVVAEIGDRKAPEVPNAEKQAAILAAREAGDREEMRRLVGDMTNTRARTQALVREHIYAPGLENLSGAEEGLEEMSLSMTGASLMSEEGRMARYAVSLGLPASASMDEIRAARKGMQGELLEEAREYGVTGRGDLAAFQQFKKRLDEKVYRAANLQQPAPLGHFLREFGQSDRDLVENANDEASLPQALHLLNGPFADALTGKFSALSQAVRRDEASRDRLDTLFLALLSRYPTPGEVEFLLPELESESGIEGYDDIVFSLLNTQQFLFIQ